MRTRPVALLAILALSVPALAGAQTKSPTTFGVVGAVNVSTFGGSDASGAENKVGFSVGGFLRYPLSKTWWVQPEVEYARKGAKGTQDFGGTPVSATLDLDYVEIPLLLRTAVSQSSSGTLFAEFGPALAFKASCSLSASSGGISVSGSCDNANLKSFDAGGMVGAGYEFPTGKMGLSVGVRYNYGFTKISSDADLQNRNLQFVAGLRF